MSDHSVNEGAPPAPSQAYNELGFALLSRLFLEFPEKDVLVSPLGVSFSLCLAGNGARGRTQKEIGSLLGWAGRSLGRVNRDNASLRSSLVREAQVRRNRGRVGGGQLELGPDGSHTAESSRDRGSQAILKMADAVWTAEGTVLKDDYTVSMGELYESQFFSSRASDAGALEAINKLIGEKTEGQIEKMLRLEDLAGSVLLIVNAVYFKGTWAERFDPEKTDLREFWTGAGKKKLYPMMSQSGKYHYYEDQNLQAVRLAFSSSGLAMYILLPRQEAALMELLGSLSLPVWQELLAKMAAREGEIVLPRFKIKSQARLDGALKSMGMKEAFGPGADFSAMISGQAFISRIMQSCMFSVDEAGAEAAASTVVVMAREFSLFEERFSMIMDHPFLFAVSDEMTEAILFMGAVQSLE